MTCVQEDVLLELSVTNHVLVMIELYGPTHRSDTETSVNVRYASLHLSKFISNHLLGVPTTGTICASTGIVGNPVTIHQV